MASKKPFSFSLVCLVGSILIFSACRKIDQGFISDRMYYTENPFDVQQGSTRTSASLIVDGSSLPLETKLLAIRNKLTGESADSMFLKPQTIYIYSGNITYLDTTEAMLRAKLKDSTVAPFSINKFGGRLQFTQSSKFLTPGTYTMDISAANSRGERVFQNVCDIVVSPFSTYDTILYKSWSTTDSTGTFFFPPDPLKVDITYDPSGDDKIVFKLLDKNGTPFNPANGEVIPRDGRPSFVNWEPYYPPVRTDTTLEFKYPAGVPQIPAYSTTVIADGSSWNDGISYYRVPARFVDINQNVNVVLTSQYFVTKGTYTITFYLTNVLHK